MKLKRKFFRLFSIVMATFLIFQAFPAKKVFATTIADQVIAEAEKYMGVPYVWGGKTPSGFDCSGFVWYVFKQFGYTLEPPTQTQVKYGTSVSFSNLQKGDLIFFDDTYPGPPPTHVGIYAGNGEMIHASDNGIARTNINTSYWKDHFSAGRRILSDVPEPGTPDTLIGAVDIYADSEAKVKIGTLNAGTNVRVKDYWSKLTSIYYNDGHVYIATSALKSKAKSVKFEESKPIYGDSNFSKVIDNLTAGSSFYISDEYSDSYRIYYQNSFAYVKKDSGTPDTLIGAVNIYADSEAKVKIGTLNAGTNVRVKDYYSKLTAIHYNDGHVYIETSALKSKAKSVKFEESKPIYGDSNFSKVIDNLTAGSSFYISDEYSDSYRIYYENSFAYVKKDKGTPDTLIGAVDIYADSEAKVKIGTLNVGTNVRVKDYYSKLTAIYYNDTHVYIATSALKSKAKSVTLQQNKPIYGDSNFSKVIDNLSAGSSFYISDEYSDSYRIYYKNSFAYVKK
jgi:uncharacterized protein YfcZ (UPF0381/DUF406 family)